MIKISLFNLTKDQTNIVKSIAMIGIVMHNFLHLVLNTGENELDFKLERLFKTIDLIRFDFSSIINSLLSFGGFYFLELFIFISGFGLTKQYQKKRTVSYLGFVLPKIIKIYFLLLFGILIYTIFFYKTIESLETYIYTIVSVLLMINNFSFDKIFNIFIGPWWYFSLIIQLYLLFPLFFKAIYRYKEKAFFGLILASFFLIYLIQPLATKFNFPIFGNSIGHLPEFLLGIGFAYFKNLKLDLRMFLVALGIFILSNISTHFFPLSFLSVTILLLFCLYPIYNVQEGIVRKVLLFLGSISMFMFLVNGPMRSYTLPYAVGLNSIQLFSLALFHLFFVVIVSSILSLFYNRWVIPFEQRVIRKISVWLG